MEFNKQVNWQTHTGDINGLWSSAAKAVQVLRVELAYCNDEGDFGELRAYFNTSTWDCDEDGLIYTDGIWLNEFRALMRSLGFTRAAVNDITYSEQGMQGDNYVSMDVGEDFMREVEPMYRFTINKAAINA
jgi:nuclear transport factor 2 (NTF2) superfamily protein